MTATKLWTWQTKILAVSLTIIAVGGASAFVAAQIGKIESAAIAQVTCIADSVANRRDSLLEERRRPIDSAILAKLDRIAVDVKRTTYFQEESMTPGETARAKALWVRDSIRWARER